MQVEDDRFWQVRDLRLSVAPTARRFVHRFRGAPWTLLKGELGESFVRLDVTAASFLDLLDGRRSVGEAWRVWTERSGDTALSQSEVIDLLSTLYRAHILTGDAPVDLEQERGRVVEARNVQQRGRVWSAIAFRTPLANPDALLDRLAPAAAAVFRPLGLGLWCLLVAFAGLMLFTSRDDLGVAFARASDPTWANGLALLAIFVALKGVHELGHGLACKVLANREGVPSTVPAFGLFWIALLPIPYVDVTSSWALPRPSQRALVAAAGMLVELAVAALAALAWAVVGEPALRDLLFSVVLVASVTTLLFNANPLLRFDGYYIASDLLQLPNLYERSRAVTSARFQRLAFGDGPPDPILGPGEVPWLISYAVASFAYRVVVCFWLLFELAPRFFGLGIALAALGFTSWVVLPWVRGLRAMAVGSHLAHVRSTAWRRSLLAAAALALLVTAVPLPDRARLPAVVESNHLQGVFAPEDAVVGAALASGTQVSPDGPPAVVLDSPELEALAARLAAELEITRIERRGALGEDASRAQALARNERVLGERLVRVRERLAALQVHATQPGAWHAPSLAAWIGTTVKRSRDEPLGWIVDESSWRVVALADQQVGPRMAERLREGDPVTYRIDGAGGPPKQGRIESIVRGGQAAGSERGFELRVRPEEPHTLAHLGSSATVRLELGYLPLSERLWRWFEDRLRRRPPS